jgi:hypothetical protein
MDGPSTRRSAALIARAPYGRDSEATEATEATEADGFLLPPFRPRSPPFAPLGGPLTNGDEESVHDLFFVRNMFFSFFGYWPVFGLSGWF